MEQKFQGLKGTLRPKGYMQELQSLDKNPFTEEIIKAPLPQGFKLPVLDKYDGSSDPIDHVMLYHQNMLIYQESEAALCRAFPSTLTGAAQKWYSKLAPGSIGGFKHLYELFVANFINSKKKMKNSTYLMGVVQRKDEKLKDYLARFNKESQQVRDLDSSFALAALLQGLKRSPFLTEETARRHGGSAQKSREVCKCRGCPGGQR